MLVLTRKPEEKIIIGNEEIVITILKVQGGKVSVGIQADKKWQIVRKELLDGEGNDGAEGNERQKFSDRNEEEAVKTVTAEAMDFAGALPR